MGVLVLLALLLSAQSCRSAGQESTDQHNAGPGVANLVQLVSIGESKSHLREYQFSSVLDVAVTEKGDIWVLDGDGTPGRGETPMLRRFDYTGEFVMHVGREGSGPGEYRAPSGLAVLPDGRVALRDFSFPNRVTLFSPEGSVDTTWSFPASFFWIFRGAVPIEVDQDGIVWIPFRTGVRPSAGQEYGFVRVGTGGEVIDTVPFPTIPEIPDGAPRPGAGRYRLHGMWTWSSLGTFAVARTDEYRVEVLPPPTLGPTEPTTDLPGSTSPPTIIFRETPPVSVPEAERRAIRERLAHRALAAGDREPVPLSQVPEIKPPIRFLSSSEDGRLLVGVPMPSYLRDQEWVEDRAYDVFEPNGRFAGRIIVPPPFRIVGMKGNRLWGVFRGDFGVESIRVYQINWPEEVSHRGPVLGDDVPGGSQPLARGLGRLKEEKWKREGT
jgi:hypothetical protein